jgi:hypothetical protein
MSNLYRQCLQSPSVLLLIVITAACSGGGGSSGAGSTPPSIETETIHGTLSVDPEYAVQSDDLMVVTPAEATSLQPDGLFTAETTTVSSHQVIVLCDKESRRPVYLGLRGPGETGVEMSLSSTATALLLFHPYLAFATAAQRDAYLVQATAHPGFATLLSLLDGAYRSDGALALDFEAHPLIYQALVLLMTDVLSGMEADFSQSQAFGLPSGPPWIEDAPGAGVNLVNPHFCWYAVQVQEAAGAVVGTFPVARVEKLVELSWTGFTKAEPVQTQLSLG